ncbi:MAG: NUDIX hydrolase [Actinomycetota bacterium]
MPDWERVSREAVYANDWIEVFDDRVIRPDGQLGVYGVVHLRTHAAGVVVFDPDRGVLLVGQERYTLGRYSWEIPEGGVPLDEDRLEGAKRELAEETGLQAERWTELLSCDLSNSVSDETGSIYLAEDLAEGPSSPEATEILQTRWVARGGALHGRAWRDQRPRLTGRTPGRGPLPRGTLTAFPQVT